MVRKAWVVVSDNQVEVPGEGDVWAWVPDIAVLSPVPLILIDGNEYNIPIIGLFRRADFLDKFAERTNDGKLHRKLIGVYFNYRILFGSITDTDEYARLWRKLTESVNFHEVSVPDGTGTPYTFEAYFSNVGDKVRKQIGNKNYFTGLTVNCIGREPART